MKPAALVFIGALLGIAILTAAGLIAAAYAEEYDHILHTESDER